MSIASSGSAVGSSSSRVGLTGTSERVTGASGMGCELGKLALAQRGGGGGGGDSEGGMQEGGAGQRGGAPAKPDPRLPLTAKQKYSMLASWKGISRAMEPTGVYMFIK
ncbi:hypothetical protein LSTR_LSTR003407 [Laodelphax striatellus]|uniref:Uncharacterized protein n=1 Tax=Laodelphax striatellus TaxID=195883 RepID=A0A482X2D1_LAOST|nr:hypothetical protein LSTR_LSTR003407 [Laodelphax striatellus]